LILTLIYLKELILCPNAFLCLFVVDEAYQQAKSKANLEKKSRF